MTLPTAPQPSTLEAVPSPPLRACFLRKSGGRITLLELALVVAASTAVTLLWLLPLIVHMNTAVLSKPNDATGTLRFYWLAAFEHRTPFTLTHDAYINAPEGTAGQSGVQIANAIQPAFVWSLRNVLGLVAAWNVFIALGFVLSASLTYVFLRQLDVRRVAAVFGAYVFGFNSYMFQKATSGHGGLVQAWVFPLTALLLLRRERNPRFLNAALVGVAVAVASYLHTYYGLIDAVLVVVAYVISIVRRPRTDRRFTTISALVSVAAAVICLVPATVGQYVDSGGSVSQNSHPLESLQQFGSRPLAYLAPARDNPAFGWILSAGQRNALEQSAEPTLFFGWTTILLATTTVVMLVRRRWRIEGPVGQLIVTAAVLIPVGYYMSLPRIVHLGPFEFPAASWFLGHLTTVFRVYARFAVLVGLGLVVLAAVAVDRLSRKVRLGGAIAIGLTAVVAVELIYALPLPVWRTNNIPAHDRLLMKAPKGIVAFYPAPNGESEAAGDLANAEMWFQTYTHRRLFFSSQAYENDRTSALRAVAKNVDGPYTPRVLAAENVRYVVLDAPTYRAMAMTVPAISSKNFRLIRRQGGVRIYRVTASKVNLDRLLHDNPVLVGQALWGTAGAFYSGPNFYGKENRYGVPWRWMRQDGEIKVEGANGGEYVLEFHAFSAHVPHKLTVIGPGNKILAVTTVPTADVPFTLGPFELPYGTQSLTLHVDPEPAPLSVPDPRVASIYLSPLTLAPYADFSRSGGH